MLSDEYRLSNIVEDKDIKTLSKAQFPGPHCPLFGAVMTASYIEDLTLLIIGTEECTYYGKDFAMIRQNGKDRVYSAVLEQHDITFGCEEDLKNIIKEIDRKEKPKALMVITTCVVELIGEDVESILRSLRKEVDTKLLIVKTEHFKCNSHIDGVKKALEQLASLMIPMEKKERTVNILGFKYLGIEKTELYKELRRNNVDISMTIPTKVNIESIQKAVASSLNIVVEPTAMGLAEEMKNQLDIPYIVFPMALDVDKIKDAYEQIGDILDIDFDYIVKEKYNTVNDNLITAKQYLRDKTFIYGNTPFNCFEFCLFLVELGMVPIIIQCRELMKDDRKVIDELIDRGIDPYIVRMANIAPLRRIYDELSPNYYFGHESPMTLAKHNIIQVVTDNCAKKLGFEKITEVIDTIINEKGIFSLMGGDNIVLEDKVKDKIKNLKNVPKPMKDLLMNMKEMPQGMKEALLTVDEKDSLIDMMKSHGNRMERRH
ncbi:hypothetical protein SH1V18_00120 [Vallitalea longa]|uniref:Nitrogenase/oxidoreductase component 1 domain-containing protein n=1 Tax=Vallitalea longa TaxID=2936439 RepID=A0A9W5Y712_9FIRM|nr:nitrogenase component 1 [Vallitalea longa]GKX27532.1 hypothetical protein SH1V18_00120 [Vallitalea longa]